MTTIYLSSSYEDLKEHRRAVFDALRKSGYTVIAMEDYVATDRRPLDACLKDIDERANIYVGIFGFRYGYIPPDHHIRKCKYTTKHDDWNGLSITELEFKYAQKNDLPCLTFVVKDGTSWPLEYVDAYAERNKEHAGYRVDRLREHLLTEKLASEFTSPLDLASLVQSAVAKHLQTTGDDYTEKVPPVTTVTWDIEKFGSPYPGLMHFTRRYAPVFFGREVEVNDIFERIYNQNNRFILVSGDSGVGKSSVVDAGVLPKLEESCLSGGKGCVCVRMVPSQGINPFDALMRSLHTQAEQAGLDSYAIGDELCKNPSDISARVSDIIAKGISRSSLVLFLDQMEELFTSQTAEHANAFITELYTAAQNEDLWVISTIRSDHLHHCYRHPDLLQVLRGHGHYPVGQVDQSSIVDIIRKPAQCAGLEITDYLVRLIVRDFGSEPSSLPLLAFVLQRLFDQRNGDKLSEQVYDGFGGIDGAIIDHIRAVEHKVREKIDEDVDNLLSKLFQTMVVVDPEGLPTRCWTLLNSFGGNLGRLVEILIKDRLISTESKGETSTVSVAHEKLFEVWPALAHWIAENQDKLRMLRLAEIEAREWEKQNHSLIYLWHEDRIENLQNIVCCMDGPAISESVRRFAQPQKTLIELLESPALSHQERQKIGIYLAEHGDPRPGVGLRDDGLPDIAWCKVPEGEIALDGRAEIFHVETLYIAKYPVTWIQYRSFIEAKDGFRNKSWWNGLAERINEPGEQYRRFDNHPAENVSWYDAIAFCRWLTERMGYEIRLPTEWQWQQAATGGDPGNKYPWGAKRDSSKANTGENDLSCTTAVGMYPLGASPTGALDMSGNVFEFCFNEYKNLDQIDVSGEVRRAVRGGSWFIPQSLARCVSRHSGFPNYGDYDLGFRLVCSSPNL